MNIEQSYAGARPYKARSSLNLSPLAIFARSVHHSYHHEHPAH